MKIFLKDIKTGLLIKASGDRKSTRLNSSHSQISYAVFCLKKKKTEPVHYDGRQPPGTDRAARADPGAQRETGPPESRPHAHLLPAPNPPGAGPVALREAERAGAGPPGRGAAGRRAPGRGGRGGPPRGAASGGWTANIGRRAPAGPSRPRRNGPPAMAAPPFPDQAPIARPRSSGANDASRI